MSKKIYIGNIPFTFTDKELKEAFAEYGEITEATVVMDKYSGRSRGFGFVTFADDAAADKAIEAMNGKSVSGRELKVNEARSLN